MIKFILKKTTNSVGAEIDALFKQTTDEKGVMTEEEWTNVSDLDLLFDTCTRKWPRGWDLEKLLTCIRECDFE
jgi:hypothetical protein